MVIEGYDISLTIFNLPIIAAEWKNKLEPTILDDNEVRKLSSLYKDATNPKAYLYNTVIKLFLHTGIRCQEGANLLLDDIDWDKRVLNICKTKNYIDRSVPMSDDLYGTLINYILIYRPKSESRSLFLKYGCYIETPYSKEGLRGIIRRAFKTYGIDKSSGTHIVRKTFSSRLFQASNSIKAVADIIGHSSLQTTTIYTKLDFGSYNSLLVDWPKRDLS